MRTIAIVHIYQEFLVKERQLNVIFQPAREGRLFSAKHYSLKYISYERTVEDNGEGLQRRELHQERVVGLRCHRSDGPGVDNDSHIYR